MENECHCLGFLDAIDCSASDPRCPQAVVAKMSELEPLEHGSVFQARIPRHGAKFRVTGPARFRNQAFQDRRESRVNRLREVHSGFHQRGRIANRVAREIDRRQVQLALPQAARLIKPEEKRAPHPPGGLDQGFRDLPDFIVLPYVLVFRGCALEAEPPQGIGRYVFSTQCFFENHSKYLDVANGGVPADLLCPRREIAFRKLAFDLMRGGQVIRVEKAFNIGRHVWR